MEVFWTLQGDGWLMYGQMDTEVETGWLEVQRRRFVATLKQDEAGWCERKGCRRWGWSGRADWL